MRPLYPIPYGYECYDTDFGTVVVKAYSQEYGPIDASRVSTEAEFFIHKATHIGFIGFSVDTHFARHKCAADGNNIHLPMPKSEAENQWYQSYAAKASIPRFWLGINDVDVEGEWKTDNGELQTYFKWHPKQPNNAGGNQHYVHTNIDTGGTWGDHSENAKFPVLCTSILKGTVP